MRKKKAAPVPTPEQLEALRAYALEKGRNWKRKLRADWLHAAAQIGGVHSPLLQQIRNDFGPEWLNAFQFTPPSEEKIVVVFHPDSLTGDPVTHEELVRFLLHDLQHAAEVGCLGDWDWRIERT